MAITIKHKEQTVVADDPLYPIGADEWNDDHDVAGASSGALVFVNGSAFDVMSGTSWDDTNRALTLTGATVTTSNPILNLTQTWNAGAVPFTALKLNVTGTAYAVGSRLLDIQLGGTTSALALGFYDATPSYALWMGQSSPSNSNYAVLSYSGETYLNSISSLSLRIGDSNQAIVTSGFFIFGSAVGFGYSDAFIYRDAAGILAQRNGTTSQAFRLYNSYTDGSNFERTTIDWKTTANVAYLRNEQQGSGTARLLVYRSGEVAVADLPSAATAGSGSRAFVNNATATTFLSTVAGGGSNKVPVVSDGTNWLIG